MLELLEALEESIEDMEPVHNIYELDPEAMDKSITPDVMHPYCVDRDKVTRLLQVVRIAYINGLTQSMEERSIELRKLADRDWDRQSEEYLFHRMQVSSEAEDISASLHSTLEADFDPTPITVENKAKVSVADMMGAGQFSKPE